MMGADVIDAGEADTSEVNMYFQVRDTNVRLLGSIHRFPAGDRGMPEWALAAIEWPSEVIFEAIPGSITDYVKPPAGELPRALSQNLSDRLAPSWPYAGGPLGPFASLHPWAIAALTPSIRLAWSANEGIEAAFTSRANHRGIPIRYLETGEALARLFDEVPIGEIETALGILLDDEPSAQHRLLEMYNAWHDQDAEAFAIVASQQAMFQLPGIRRKILAERNMTWVPSVEALLGNGHPTLVVVGALHLQGPDSLIKYLGRDVDRII